MSCCDCIEEKKREIARLKQEVLTLTMAQVVRKLMRMPDDEREALQLLHRRDRKTWEQEMQQVQHQCEQYRKRGNRLHWALVVAFGPACVGAAEVAQGALRLWW